MFLRKLPVTSNASRHVSKFMTGWLDKTNYSRTHFTKLNKAGRGLTGRQIIRTRGSILNKLRLPRITYNLRSKAPLLLSTIRVVPFYSKMVSLMVLPSGSLCYLPALDRHPVFSVVYFQSFFSSSWYKKSHICLTLVGRVKQYRRISNIEAWPGRGIQYARSAGSWGKITKRDYLTHTAVAFLPSGVRKIVSTFSLILPNRSLGIDKRIMKNTKSGYRRSFGFKSIVRGVAMNPVDHPHGGRTKAIKYPRTPWGKTTKFK